MLKISIAKINSRERRKEFTLINDKFPSKIPLSLNHLFLISPPANSKDKIKVSSAVSNAETSRQLIDFRSVSALGVSWLEKCCVFRKLFSLRRQQNRPPTQSWTLRPWSQSSSLRLSAFIGVCLYRELDFYRFAVQNITRRFLPTPEICCLLQIIRSIIGCFNNSSLNYQTSCLYCANVKVIWGKTFGLHPQERQL